ncbi:MAG TPA: CAP domain-containing protein [Solirubrobacterales bacterium]|nr:CAP domain-containing protein [Solirubrobacterales bacterium]
MLRRLSILVAALSLAALAAAPAQAMNLSRLIAPATACPNQTDIEAPAGAQETAMRCMTNFARRHAGDSGLADTAPLDTSAADKSRDILRCDSFSHYACGRDFTFWFKRTGYTRASCWRVGENIAWGTGEYGTVRGIFSAWIHSPEHRENILGDYRQLGVGLRVGNVDGYRDAHVWTQHFGAHC